MSHSESVSLWKKDILAWSLYDFANTIYSMNIVSLYLKRYIVQDLGHPDHYFDLPFAASMLIAACVLPALGAMSDHTTKRKIFVFLFTLTCCMSVGLMAFVPAEFILGIVILFIISNFSYEAAQPFYNSLLYSVAEGKHARAVSGLGVSIGYVGSIAGMILVLPFVSGSMFGMEIPFVSGSGKTGSFLPTAALFLLFSLPLFFFVRERRSHTPEKVTFRQAYRDVWSALRNTRKYPGVLRFLIADYFFEDAAFTVILNIGLYCSIVLGLPEEQITTFLIISTVSAVVGAFVVGKIAERWSLKNLMTIIMSGWVVALVAFASTDSMPVVWVLGSVVGILLGGLWTTSRPMLAELVPKEELGRFFGIFALSGRAAAVVGPVVWTAIIYLFQPENMLGRWAVQSFNLSEAQAEKLPYKLGVLSLAGMIVIGLAIFRKVPHTTRMMHG
ncbi:MAG: MFS transporter [bacterium]|nr:MFS transporter [bacterium]